MEVGKFKEQARLTSLAPKSGRHRPLDTLSTLGVHLSSMLLEMGFSMLLRLNLDRQLPLVVLYKSHESGDFDRGPVPRVSLSHVLESDIHGIGSTSHQADHI